MEIVELLAFGEQPLAFVGGQPRFEVSGVVVAVHRRPLVLHALDRAEQLGAPEAVELALRQPKSILPREEVVDVVRLRRGG